MTDRQGLGDSKDNGLGGRGCRPGGGISAPLGKLDPLMADKESGVSEQPPLGGVSDPQGRRTASLPPSLSPSRSPGRAGPSSILPLPPPTPGRCAWQPPGRISWHWSENKQHSAPVIPLPRRPLRGRRGRVGGVSGAWAVLRAHSRLGSCGGGGGGAGPGDATRQAPRVHSSHSSVRAPAVSGK